MYLKMRLFLILVFLVIFAIISIPCYLMEFLIGKSKPRLQVKIAQAIVRFNFKIILFLAGTKITCKGLENVPKDEAVLYVANHRDYFDILLGYTTVPTLTGFVSKKELKKVPCINHWMFFLKCLFLDRENTKEGLKTILQGIAQLKDGYSIFIMPEGTRNSQKDLLPFHEGSFKLASKSGAAVVPVAMKGTDKVLSNHFAWFHRTPLTIVYGEPIYIDKLPKEQQKFVGAHVQKIVQEMLEKLDTDMVQ